MNRVHGGNRRFRSTVMLHALNQRGKCTIDAPYEIIASGSSPPRPDNGHGIATV